jgi:hypothetical protein
VRADQLIALSVTAIVVAGLFACASRKKGTTVVVVRNPDAVRGCEFLGRVGQSSTEQTSPVEGMLRQRVAEMGGDTLLLLAAGSGEAWKCGADGSARAWVESPAKERTPHALSRPPTPRVTIRY